MGWEMLSRQDRAADCRSTWGKSILAILVMWLFAFSSSAKANDYPSRSIELIVPGGAGSTTDVAIRFLAEKWSEFLGQPIVVVNRPGGGGGIGVEAAARAKPDGYTLLGVYDSLMVALPVARKASYNLDSFDYLNGFGVGSIYFSVRSDSPYKTIQDFISAAKKAEKKLTYASYGQGVIAHFAAERLWELGGVNLQYVPYRSSPDATAALLGGHVDMAVTSGTYGVANNPAVRVLAVASESRRADYPNILTLKEQGYPVSLDYMSGIAVPAGTPAQVKEKLLWAIDQTNKKYSKQLQETIGKADLVYSNIPGDEMKARWRDRAEWFQKVKPRLNMKD